MYVGSEYCHVPIVERASHCSDHTLWEKIKEGNGITALSASMCSGHGATKPRPHVLGVSWPSILLKGTWRGDGLLAHTAMSSQMSEMLWQN